MLDTITNAAPFIAFVVMIGVAVLMRAIVPNFNPVRVPVKKDHAHFRRLHHFIHRMHVLFHRVIDKTHKINATDVVNVAVITDIGAKVHAHNTALMAVVIALLYLVVSAFYGEFE